MAEKNPRKQYSSNTLEITNKKVEAMIRPQLTPRKGKRPKVNINVLRDNKVSNFSIRYYPSGKKSWFYYYRDKLSGKEFNYHIGNYPDLGTNGARREATRLAGVVAGGGNPHLERKSEIKAGTFAEYSALYSKAILPKKSNKTELNIHRLHLIPFLGQHKLADILPVHIETLRNSLAHIPTTGTKAKMYAHKFFKWCIKNGYMQTNPATDIADFPKNKRQFYLTDTQFAKLSAELQKREKTFPIESYFIGLMVATGCRPEELFRRPWIDVDFETKQLFNIPSKTGRITKSLSPTAIDLFKRLAKLTAKDSPWCFPSPNNWKKHRVSFRTFWYDLRDSIGLTPQDQMRDMRHHYATNLLRQGVGIETVSKLMNHTSIKTTADHYAHVLTEVKEKALAKTSKTFKLL